jgi:hypothetical protein
VFLQGFYNTCTSVLYKALTQFVHVFCKAFTTCYKCFLNGCYNICTSVVARFLEHSYKCVCVARFFTILLQVMLKGCYSMGTCVFEWLLQHLHKRLEAGSWRLGAGGLKPGNS